MGKVFQENKHTCIYLIVKAKNSQKNTATMAQPVNENRNPKNPDLYWGLGGTRINTLLNCVKWIQV